MNKRNNFAISSGGVADALKRYGSVASSYGVNLSDAVAMISATNEAIQDPAQVGTGLKTISLRLAGLKTSAKDGTVGLNSTAKALQEIAGISIFEDKQQTQVKDMFTILNELDGVFDNLTEKDQLALGTALGGANRANVLQSLLNNWEQVLRFRDEYDKGNIVGSAERENDIYMNSIEGKLNVLKQNLRDIVDNLVSSDMFKGIVDGASTVAEAILNVIKALDKMNMSAPVALGGLMALFSTIKTLAGGGKSVGLIGGSLFKGGWSQFGKDILTVATSSEKASTKVKLLGTSFQGLSLGTGLANVAMTALNGLIMTGVVVAIGFAVKKVYEWVNANKIAKQQAEESLKANQQQLEVYKQEKDTLSSLAKEYEELSKKKQRTEEDNERLLELSNELAEKYPDLISGYDENGVAIIDLNNLDDAMAKMDELIAKQERLERQSKIDLGLTAIKENADIYADNERVKDEKNKHVYKSDEQRAIDNAKRLLDYETELDKVYKSNGLEQRRKALNSLQRAYSSNASTIEREWSESQKNYSKYLETMEQGQAYVYETIFQRNENFSAEQEALTKKIASGLDFSKIYKNLGQDGVDTLTNIIGKGVADGSFDAGGSLRYLKDISNATEKLKQTENPFEYLNSIEKYIPQFAELLGISEEMAKKQLLPDDYFYKPKNEMDAFLMTFEKTVGNTDAQTQKLKKSYEEISKAKDILSNSANLVEENGELVLNQQVVRDFIEDPNLNTKLKSLMKEANADGKVTEAEMNVITKVNAQMEKGKESVDPKTFLDLQKDLNAVFGKNKVSVDMYLDPQYMLPDMNNAMKAVDGLNLDVESTVKIKTAVMGGDINEIQTQLMHLPTEKQVSVLADISQYMVSMGVIKQEEVSDRVVQIVAQDLATGKINEVQALEIMEKYAKVLGIDLGATDLIQRVEKATGKTISLTGKGVDSGASSVRNTIDGAKSKTVTLTVQAKYGNMATYNALKKEGFINATPEMGTPIPDFSTSVQTLNDSIIADTIDMQENGIMPIDGAMPIDSPTGGTGGVQSRNYSKPLETIKYNYNYFIELENQLKKINNQLDMLDIKSENAIGQEKIGYLQQQIALYKEQQRVQSELINDMNKYQSSLKSFLSGKGFGFDVDGNITNYHTKLISMEKELERLEEIANKEKATDKQKKAYEDYREQLEEIKKVMSEYVDITFTKLPNAQEEWDKLNNSIVDTQDEIKKLQFEMEKAVNEVSKIKFEIQFDKLNISIKKIQKNIRDLDRQIDNAFGSKKEQLIKQKIELLKQEQVELKKLSEKYQQQAKDISTYLSKKGFNFGSDGSVSNMEQLEKFIDTEEFDYIKQQLEEYISITSDKIPSLSDDWLDLQDGIDDCNQAIIDAKKELQDFLKEAKVESLLDKFNDLQHEINMVDKALEYSNGNKKLDLMSQKIELLKKQQLELQKQFEYFDSQKNSLQNYLGNVGFNFDSEGNITNYVEQLERLGNSVSNFEEIKEKLEEYFEVQENKLPSIEEDWADLENTIKDVLKEQLNTAKEIEDKITEMYKKQIQDRIDTMKKETDAKIKELKKQQDAYNKYRNEVDYQNEYDEKASEISDLQKQLDIALRDTSISGQQKVKELQKMIADAQKELEKITQDKIDSDINDMFDKESDRLQEESDKAIEDFENTWNDAKIAEMVAQALGSGIFTDIEGNVSSLEDALIDFAEETGELFGVLGSVIKSELITNLGIATETVKNLGEIMKELDLSKFAVEFTPQLSLGQRSAVATATSANVSLTSPLIVVNGNVDNGVMADLEKFGTKIYNDVINAISGAIR